MSGEALKKIDQNRLRQRQVWRVLTLRRIDALNETGDGFLGVYKDVYALEFRGRNHYSVLTRDGEVIARGIIEINKMLDFLEMIQRVNDKERRK